MNYRSSGEFTTPFRVFPFLEECGVNRLDLNVRIRADISQNLFATNVIVRIPLPKLVTRFQFNFYLIYLIYLFFFKKKNEFLIVVHQNYQIMKLANKLSNSNNKKNKLYGRLKNLWEEQNKP